VTLYCTVCSDIARDFLTRFLNNIPVHTVAVCRYTGPLWSQVWEQSSARAEVVVTDKEQYE